MKKAYLLFITRKLVFIFTIILIFTTFTLSAQTKTNFTGTWNLNTGQSQLGEGFGRRAATKMVITQTANSLTNERTSTRQSGETITMKESYNLDGTETDNSSDNRKKKSNASWSANMEELTVVSSTVFERDGNTMEMKSTEVYKLSSDKIVLTIENVMSSQRGDFKTTLVYDLVQ